MLMKVEAMVYIRGYCDKCDDELVLGPITLKEDNLVAIPSAITQVLSSHGWRIKEEGTWICAKCVADEGTERRITEETPSV